MNYLSLLLNSYYYSNNSFFFSNYYIIILISFFFLFFIFSFNWFLTYYKYYSNYNFYYLLYHYCFLIKSCLFLLTFLYLYHISLFFFFDYNRQPLQMFFSVSIGKFIFDFGIDGLSLLFLLLTSFILLLAVLIHYYLNIINIQQQINQIQNNYNLKFNFFQNFIFDTVLFVLWITINNNMNNKLLIKNKITYNNDIFSYFSGYKYFRLNLQTIFYVTKKFGNDFLLYDNLINLIFEIKSLKKFDKFFLLINNNFKNEVIKFYFIIETSHKFLFFVIFLYITLVVFFTTLNLFIFYISFELTMIPLFFIIGWFGSRINKIKAANYMFFYTIVSSIPFLLALLCLYFLTGTLDLITLSFFKFDIQLQIFFFFLFFIPFSVKVPMIPFHIWLPEAHVEASTEGSVILAGLLLKLGIYGVLKFLIPIFPAGLIYFSSLLYLICLISIIYTSFIIFCQNDLKKIIAYSSIAHMNYALLGILSMKFEGLIGCVFICFTHAIISGGLFFSIGLLYFRYKTRLLSYYSGLTYYLPVFSVFFFLLSLGNMSFPGFGSFIGEILVLFGIFSDNLIIGIFSLITSLFSTFYSIFIFTKICFGLPNFSIFYCDKLNLNLFYIEYSIFFSLILYSVVTGFFSSNYFFKIEEPLFFIYSIIVL